MRGYSVRKKKQFNALIRLDNYMMRLYVSCHDTHVLRLTDTNCNHSYLLIAGSTFGFWHTIKNGKSQRNRVFIMSPLTTTRSGVSDRRPLASGESMLVARLDVESGVDARKSGDAPKMKVADCRPTALGRACALDDWTSEGASIGNVAAQRESRERRLDGVIAVLNGL